MIVPTFDGWNAVPPGLALKSQLADMDLPRSPGGPVRGFVNTRNALGRRDSFPLYDIAESTPTKGSARQLDQAAARRSDRCYICADCGANSEQHLGVHDPCHRGGVTSNTPCPMLAPRCPACRHLAELRAAQQAAAIQRVAAVEWARALVERSTTTLVRISAVLPEPAYTTAGRRRPVLGHRLDVIASYGSQIRVMVPRGTTEIDSSAFRDRDVICWSPAEASLLRKILHIGPDDHGVRPEPDLAMSEHVDHTSTTRTKRPRSISGQMLGRVAAWRALIDPATGSPMLSTDPGPADRCLLLMRRMAVLPDGAFPAVLA